MEKKITHMVLSDNILAEWCGVTYRPVKSQAKCALYRLKYIFFLNICISSSVCTCAMKIKRRIS